MVKICAILRPKSLIYNRLKASLDHNTAHFLSTTQQHRFPHTIKQHHPQHQKRTNKLETCLLDAAVEAAMPQTAAPLLTLMAFTARPTVGTTPTIGLVPRIRVGLATWTTWLIILRVRLWVVLVLATMEVTASLIRFVHLSLTRLVHLSLVRLVLSLVRLVSLSLEAAISSAGG
jgi:hypothetical protein